MDLNTLINNLRADGSLQAVATNPRVQFGTAARPYLGPTILPDRPVPENQYTEEGIRFKTIVANDGTRYSPVQIKGGEMAGAFEVKLAESDIGREFSGKDYDTFLRLIANASMDAAVRILNWADVTLVRALADLREKQRWQAILDGTVKRRGNNKYAEDVEFTKPAGHRVNAGGTWSNDNYDPYDDITAMINLLDSKGYKVKRIITRRGVLSILARNANIRKRGGLVTINNSGQLVTAPGFFSNADLNALFQADGLPPIEEYNLLYHTQDGSFPFLREGSMVFVCETGRDEAIDLGDEAPIVISDTIGYTGIGRPTGESTPGAVVKLFPYEDKPPRIEGQAWQTSMPVITEPEAFAVINNIA